MASTRVPRYELEDTSLTSTKELRGWFSYGMAAEIFAVCGIGSFLPVTLEQLARERGVLWSDKTTSCVTSVKDPEKVRALRHSLVKRDDSQCIVQPFGKEITTASFAMYTFSLAVLVQAAVLVSLSSFADHVAPALKSMDISRQNQIRILEMSTVMTRPVLITIRKQPASTTEQRYGSPQKYPQQV
ncbi:MAG: hypothetical protein Q9191_002720 [Dirinaria sp. TL-2023a]